MKPRLPISRLRAEEFDAVLDAALQPESDRLVPSSGFTESVMSAVRAEAAAPPPIPFPWMRALPGIAAASAMLATLVFLLATGIRLLSTVRPDLSPAAAARPAWPGALASPATQGILLAAAITGVTLLVCRVILASGASHS